MSGETTTARYVYGFTRAGAVQEIRSPGVGGSADVRAIRIGAIAALVGPIDLAELRGPDGADRALDLEWVAPRALRHQQVIEEAMAISPVLPLRFGVVFSSEERLAETIGPRVEQIAAFLDGIEGKQEWGIKVWADAARLREHVERSPRFRALCDRLPDSPGARYLHEKRLRRELDRLAIEERRAMAERIRQELASSALGSKPLRLASRQATGRAEEMALHLALLAAADRAEALLQQVRALAEAYRPAGIAIEATGPWPPYSFGPALQVEP